MRCFPCETTRSTLRPTMRCSFCSSHCRASLVRAVSERMTRPLRTSSSASAYLRTSGPSGIVSSLQFHLLVLSEVWLFARDQRRHKTQPITDRASRAVPVFTFFQTHAQQRDLRIVFAFGKPDLELRPPQFVDLFSIANELGRTGY